MTLDVRGLWHGGSSRMDEPRVANDRRRQETPPGNASAGRAGLTAHGAPRIDSTGPSAY